MIVINNFNGKVIQDAEKGNNNDIIINGMPIEDYIKAHPEMCSEKDVHTETTGEIDEVTKYWMDMIGGVLKDIKAKSVTISAPGSTTYMGGVHIYQAPTANDTACD